MFIYYLLCNVLFCLVTVNVSIYLYPCTTLPSITLLATSTSVSVLFLKNMYLILIALTTHEWWVCLLYYHCHSICYSSTCSLTAGLCMCIKHAYSCIHFTWRRPNKWSKRCPPNKEPPGSYNSVADYFSFFLYVYFGPAPAKFFLRCAYFPLV